ncbi:MAG TPA: type II 3-dehydroquinate dehydratase [Solirubrobacteraceae bacterium]|nr:type II 3-dehydroquinate dehydratase [Solirubrobacteraceae bacterium]
MTVRNRIEVMHGVNLDQLGRRDPAQYGTVTLDELEVRIGSAAEELGLQVRFFRTNHEGEFVERLHRLEGLADGLVLNPGAWSHYSYAIRDALELAGLPAVEVHLSDIKNREPWRRQSVISELCLATISGRGPEGYGQALARLHDELAGPGERGRAPA